jgi:hypothetical protein
VLAAEARDLGVDHVVARRGRGALDLKPLPLHLLDVRADLEARLVPERVVGLELGRRDGRLGEGLDLLIGQGLVQGGVDEALGHVGVDTPSKEVREHVARRLPGRNPFTRAVRWRAE